MGRQHPGKQIKGGRLRKTAVGIISFALFLASVSAVALGALLGVSSSAEAGMPYSCSPISPS